MFINTIIIICLGILFGSFGSVLLGRLENKHDRKTIKSILIGRSQCPHCKHTLSRKELIPLASYLMQGGKCKHCHTIISKEYPILEILCGTIFGITYLRTTYIGISNSREIVFRIITNWFLMLMIIHDFKTYELHVPIRILSMIWIWGWQITGTMGNIWIIIQSTLISLIMFVGIYFFGKRYVYHRFHTKEEGFGQGDIFIGATLGSLIPYIGTYHSISLNIFNNIQILLSLFILASIIGIVYAIIQGRSKHQQTIQGGKIFEQRQKTNKIIPFIPSLILAFWIILYKADILKNILF